MMHRDEMDYRQWLAWRHRGIGSSDIAAILGENPYKSKLEVFLEKTDQKKPADLSKNYAVQKGIALEPLARNLINKTLGSNFIPGNYVHDVFNFMKYSSDGHDKTLSTIIEIKCMGERNHTKVLTEKKIIPYYYPQVQWGLMVSRAELALFVSYCPSLPENLAVVEIKPSSEYFSFMEEKAIAFWLDVMTFFENKKGE